MNLQKKLIEESLKKHLKFNFLIKKHTIEDLKKSMNKIIFLFIIQIQIFPK